MTEYIDKENFLKIIYEHSYDLVDCHNSKSKGMFLEGIEQAVNEVETINIAQCPKYKNSEKILIPKRLEGELYHFYYKRLLNCCANKIN